MAKFNVALAVVALGLSVAPGGGCAVYDGLSGCASVDGSRMQADGVTCGWGAGADSDCSATMRAWMVRYQDALGHSDPTALRALIDPQEGIRIAVSAYDPDENSQSHDEGIREWQLPREQLTGPLFKTLQKYLDKTDYNYPASRLDCARTPDLGRFRCVYTTGGFVGDYRWRVEGEGAYLGEIFEESH